MAIDETLDDLSRDDDLVSPDVRRPRVHLDSRRQGDGEISDSDDEGEGGRRNHARYRDNDSNGVSSGNESGGGRKFGVGIMNSGQATSTHHGAGPSGHTTVARFLSAANSAPLSMDVDDTPPTSENGTGPMEVNDMLAPLADDMSVDETA